MAVRRGFASGAVLGTVLAALGLLVLEPARTASSLDAGTWVARNLGHSVWAFGLVLLLFLLHLGLLSRRLAGSAQSREIVQLDQLSDVWINLFIGIGVVWTAVGMRGALETTLGGPDGGVSGSAGTVLERLVDGGILLALTTTIVGAVGGYLMRLVKTLAVGASLHDYYRTVQAAELRELIASARRIEASLRGAAAVRDPAPVTHAPAAGTPHGRMQSSY
ncbi:MAG: hypothetical protein V2I63_05645 [Pseudomonadales bacterium]|nr:hypothetical protein [Pseudomonadales bacterium]